jgi:drug/metabolite transporter (DMT)-like permease
MADPVPRANAGAQTAAGDASVEASVNASVWLAAMPGVFVLIWSTGFVVARYGMPHAPPFGFLALRFALSIVCLGAWSVWSRAVWPRSSKQWLHLGVTGVLMHAGYLGGVWAAVKQGMGAGTVSLIVGLQPLLTALWLAAHRPGSDASVVRPVGPRLGAREWVGLLLGLFGLLLVVQHKLGQGELSRSNLICALLALLAITAGTLYQKRYVQPCDVRTANSVQLVAALVGVAPLALLESGPFDWHPQLIGALAWSVFALTLGGSSLLYLLIQRGAATQVTSLMYLVPPCTALLAWVLFDEAVGPSVWVGTALTVLGVACVVRPRRLIVHTSARS